MLPIIYHPIKSNGTIKKVGFRCKTWEELRSSFQAYGTQGKYFYKGTELPQADVLSAYNSHFQKKKEEIKLLRKQKEEAALRELQEQVSRTCSPEEETLFWLLYGNLEAEFCPAAYIEEDDSIEIFFKRLPIARIKIK